MAAVTCGLTVSLDGFVAGPEQASEDPIGDGVDSRATSLATHVRYRVVR